jgi:hypothetical protein
MSVSVKNVWHVCMCDDNKRACHSQGRHINAHLRIIYNRFLRSHHSFTCSCQGKVNQNRANSTLKMSAKRKSDTSNVASKKARTHTPAQALVTAILANTSAYPISNDESETRNMLVQLAQYTRRGGR